MKETKSRRGGLRRRPAFVVLCVAALALAFLSGCSAIDIGAFPWSFWVVDLINFAIFAGIIIYFGGSYIQEYFASRRENFLREMNAAKEARKQAEAKLEEFDTKLEVLEQERQALLDEYHAQGEREKQRIIETAKREVEKMRSDAEATIEQEVKKAVAMLEEQAVDLAVDMARQQAQKKLDEEGQRKLFERYVSDLDERGPTLN